MELNNLSPYSELLASGEHQMRPHYFSMEAIEAYFFDPRYIVRFSEFTLRIVPDSHNLEHLSEDDIFHLRAGIGWSSEGERVLAIFLYDLAQLTPRVQRAVSEFERPGKHTLDPDFYTTHIEGLPPKYLSAYEAILALLPIIDELHYNVTGIKLYLSDFSENRPREFSVFNKPTSKAFGEFKETANKILIDNINRKAFPRIEPIDTNGRTKGTISLFMDFLRSFGSIPDEDIDNINGTLRKLQSNRSKVAHKVNELVFDPSFYDQQIQWMKELFGCIKRIYVIYRTYIAGKSVELPYWFDMTVRYG